MKFIGIWLVNSVKYAFLILAGGKGSRLYPLTVDCPKPYLPVYYDNNEIIRMLDIPIEFCMKQNIPIYLAVDYKSDVLDYLKENKNIKFIYTRNDNLCDSLAQCLCVLKDDGVEKYSVYAGDFLIPEEVILKMMEYMDKYEKVVLCSRVSKYSKIKLNDDELTDLTFHISKVDSGLKKFACLNDVSLIWKDEDVSKVKKVITEVNNIDMGIPDSYYEAVIKLNSDKVDSNGNLLFSNAKVNPKSLNVIALPNSDSSEVILKNAIVPEGKKICSQEEALSVNDINANYFDDICIKKYIRSR